VGFEMFVHFKSDPNSECDNCETRGTIMEISVERLGHTLSLCVACFTAMFRVFSVASQKLILRGDLKERSVVAETAPASGQGRESPARHDFMRRRARRTQSPSSWTS
jgi:hypothetical protein